MKLTKLGIALIFSAIFTITFLLSNIPPVEAQTDNIGIRGDNISISAILLQNGTYGIPVPNQVIEFYDHTYNSFLNVATTNDNGVASIIWDIPIDYPLGSTIINATYRGNESLYLAPSCQWVTITILSLTQLYVEYDHEVFAPGDVFSLEVTLFDDSSIPMQYATVSVYCENVLLATSITNISGSTTFSIHCNNSWSSIGDNIIQIVFEQDLENYYSRAEETFSIEIQKIETQIITDPLPEQVILGNNLDVAITLSDSMEGISAELDIFLDGYFLVNTNTDDFGNCTLSLNIDERFSLGSHILRITYHGDERYLESIVSRQLDIFSYVSMNCETKKTAVVNTVVNLNIQLHDLLNRPVEGKIQLFDYSIGLNKSVQIPIDSTEFVISYIIMNQVGLHDLQLKVENTFALNGSMSYILTVWSLPVIELSQTNVYHYASPQQEILFSIHLTDFSGNISHREVQLLLDDQFILSSLTNESGMATITTNAPLTEGVYNCSILCPKNLTRYELLTKIDYQLIVTTIMPLVVDTINLEIIPPLQIIKVKLQVTCLNGTLLEGIHIKFSWFALEKNSITKENGMINLQLPLPSINGNYSLHYEINATSNLAQSSGVIHISITSIVILASQGIGINGFVISLVVSSIIFVIPLARQRYFF